MKRFVENIRGRSWFIPAVLLLISLLAYGLLTPFLGFFQDDWHFNYYYLSRGAPGLADLLYNDGHPSSAWFYIIAFRWFKLNPVSWQLFSIFWRWLTAVAVWKLLDQLWHKHPKQIFTATLFFLLYPAYTLQPQAIVYFEIWISYALLITSFYLTGKGVQEKRPGDHVLGIVIKIFHLFTSVYVTGLEFVRPFIIWKQLSDNDPQMGIREKSRKMLWLWSPYLLLNTAFIIWRVFFYQSPVENRAYPTIVFSFIHHPLATIKLLLDKLIPDLILILGSSWNTILEPGMFKDPGLITWPLLAVMLFSGAVVWFTLTQLENDSQPELPSNILGFGGLFLLFGLAPFYAIGYFINDKLAPWNGRVVLGSLIGTGLIAALLIFTFISVPKKQTLLVAILVALLIGRQVRSINEFRRSWEKQLNFYQQMMWRIPSLQENTAIFASQEILFLMGDYPTSFAINAMYASPTPLSQQNIPYWFFTVTGSFWGKEENLAEGMPVSDQRHSINFSGDSKKSIVIRFEPDSGECLWVLRPQDSYSHALNSSERMLAPISDLSRIQAQSAINPEFEALTGSESHRWCYFYQKADLSRQLADWKNVTMLWNTAQSTGETPGNGFEYSPFIEAFARTNDWESALKLTKTANLVSPAMYHTLCPLWRELFFSTPDSDEKQAALGSATEILKCAPFSPDSISQ